MTFWQSDASAIYEQFVKTELTLVCCETFLSWDSVWQGEYCVNCSCLFSLVKIGLCDLLGNLKWIDTIKNIKNDLIKYKIQNLSLTANLMLKLICRIATLLIPRIPESVKKLEFLHSMNSKNSKNPDFLNSRNAWSSWNSGNSRILGMH